MARWSRSFAPCRQSIGPDSLGVISTGQLVTEEFYALGKLVQLGLGTKNYDGNTTLCMASAVSGYKRSFGSDGPPGAYEDLQKADVIFLIGANIADNHPILCQHLEANPSKTLIVADPRVTKTAMMADLFLPLKPRSDIALLNGLMHILIRAGQIDCEYIAETRPADLTELARFVEKYTPAYVSQITGLSEDLIIKTAYLYGSAQAAFIGWTMGVNHSTQGAETVNAINNLALITGNIGRPALRRFRSPDSAMRWARAKRDSRRVCQDTGNLKTPSDREELAALVEDRFGRIPHRSRLGLS